MSNCPNIFLNVLGEISDPYFLKSEYYVPERLLKMINRATSKMVETGLNELFLSDERFRSMLELRQHNFFDGDDDDNDLLQPITMQHFKRIVVFVLIFYGFAVIVLMIEKLVEITVIEWKNWKRWRNSELNLSILHFKYVILFFFYDLGRIIPLTHISVVKPRKTSTIRNGNQRKRIIHTARF